jgi:hypothetical protein
MIHDARSYLAGAAASAALIAAAVTAFVLLASLSAFRDWPVPDLGGPGDGVTAVTSGVPAQAAAAALSTAPDFVARTDPVGPPLTAGDASGATELFAGTLPPGVDLPQGPAAPGVPTAGPGDPASGPGVDSVPPTDPAPPSTSSQIAGTVNGAVGGVDDTLGGTLGETGVKQTVQDTTNTLLGPGSTGGQVVDGLTGGGN